MLGGFEQATAHLVNASEVEMREGVGFVARRLKGELEPADARPGVALGDEVAADVVVRIAEGLVQPDRFEALLYRFVVAILKTVDPAQKGVSLGGRVD